ncbi:MAG: alpha/beta hydrolase [Bdellovibrionia bacterium]
MRLNSKWIKTLLFGLFYGVVFSFNAHARVLVPEKKATQSVGLIVIQGALTPVDAYERLAREIQKHSSQEVWVSLIQFPLNMPNPLVYASVTDQARNELLAAGLQDPVFYILGHSLGGIVAQSQDVNLRGGREAENAGVSPPRTHGMILLNSYTTRQNQFLLTQLPVLTLGGELDGLTRIGRLAEAYSRQIDRSRDLAVAEVRSPVIVIPGLNHHVFLQGSPSDFLMKRDFKSLLTADQANTQLAQVIGAFLDANLSSSPSSKKVLQEYRAVTETLVRPLIDAMWLEGSYHLLPPCTARVPNGVDQNHCQKGSKWAEYASTVMAGEIPHVTFEVENVFHESYRVFPFFHPHILNQCTPGVDCVMKLTNVVQNIYASEDDRFDDARGPVAAVEMRLKMKSRQSTSQAAGLGVLDFHVTDEWDVCAEINRQALAWAEAHAPSSVLQRYRQYGLPIVMGPDQPENGGPGFIWKPIQKEVITQPGGQKALQISVPTMRTPVDFDFVPESAGYHYCRLMSPAWFMEWIYTDGLRASELQ